MSEPALLSDSAVAFSSASSATTALPRRRRGAAVGSDSTTSSATASGAMNSGATNAALRAGRVLGTDSSLACATPGSAPSSAPSCATASTCALDFLVARTARGLAGALAGFSAGSAASALCAGSAGWAASALEALDDDLRVVFTAAAGFPATAGSSPSICTGGPAGRLAALRRVRGAGTWGSVEVESGFSLSTTRSTSFGGECDSPVRCRYLQLLPAGEAQSHGVLIFATRDQVRGGLPRLDRRGQAAPAPAWSPLEGWAARGQPLSAARQEHRQVVRRACYAGQPR